MASRRVFHTGWTQSGRRRPIALEIPLIDHLIGAREQRKTTTYDGEPPNPRISLVVWDNADQFQAYRNSAALKELLPIRDKLSKFQTFSVEGLAR
jgi:hypothetical protein